MKRIFAPSKLFRDLGVLTFAFALALLGTIAFAQTWTEPGANPPDGNIPAPVNVGNDAQDKAGPLGVGALAVFGETTFTGDTVDFEFTNVGAEAPSIWRMARNDGTGNFMQYLNTEGGINPTLMSAGHAFRQVYNPGQGGVYRFQTSGAASAAAGTSITWNDALLIRPGGDVVMQRICAIDGNCYDVGDIIDAINGSDGVDATDFPSGSHCGIWSNMSIEFNVDCLGVSPKDACPDGFRRFHRDFQSPGNRYYATCVRSNDPYWQYGPWRVSGTSACTPSCMGGTVTTETSVAECYDPIANRVVSDSQCTSPKPADRTRSDAATNCYDVSCGGGGF